LRSDGSSNVVLCGSRRYPRDATNALGEFVIPLDEVEKRVARCNPGDRYEVSQLVAALRATR
jgi:hypothetical protein